MKMKHWLEPSYLTGDTVHIGNFGKVKNNRKVDDATVELVMQPVVESNSTQWLL